jgi:hypothetical protein
VAIDIHDATGRLGASMPSHNIRMQRIPERTYEVRLSAEVIREPNIEVELTEGAGNAPLL